MTQQQIINEVIRWSLVAASAASALICAHFAWQAWSERKCVNGQNPSLTDLLKYKALTFANGVLITGVIIPMPFTERPLRTVLVVIWVLLSIHQPFLLWMWARKHIIARQRMMEIEAEAEQFISQIQDHQDGPKR